MKSLLWVTDPHLDMLQDKSPREFGQFIAKQPCDAVVITGDISETPTLISCLTEFAEGASKEIFVVFGNHDYYKGSIAEVIEIGKKLNNLHPNLHWLDSRNVSLDENTALVGKGSWYDARAGAPDHPRGVIMSDFFEIEDLRLCSNFEIRSGYRQPIIDKVRELASTAAEEAEMKLIEAMQDHKDVIFATHYPPFPGACWHQGQISDKCWLPWFTCVTMGEMLARVAEEHPDNRVLVLCGHTHSPGEYKHSDNLKVLTGYSVYGDPKISRIFDLGTVFDEEFGGQIV